MKEQIDFSNILRPNDRVKLWNNEIYLLSPHGFLFNIQDGSRITKQQAKYQGRTVLRGSNIIAKRKTRLAEWERLRERK